MGTDYTPDELLKKVPNQLLEQYFQFREIEPKVTIEAEENGKKEAKEVHISELGEKEIEPILELIGDQTEEKRVEIDNDFKAINERACKAGVRCLIEESRWEGHHLQIAGDLEAMKSHHERVMWVFLNYAKVFENSGYFQKMDGFKLKKMVVPKNIVPRQEQEELADFKQGLKDYYGQEGRGKNCEVKVLKRSDPERFCYFVYIEDYGEMREEFLEENLDIRPSRPAYKFVFVYYPEKGQVGTNVKGSKQEIEDLMDIFSEGVLAMEDSPVKEGKIYTLERLRKRFDFQPREIKDNISFVKLREIEIEISKGKKIACYDTGKNTNIYDLIETAFDKEKVDIEKLKIVRAKIQIVFKKLANERRAKSVTFEISAPDNCSLKELPLDQIAEKYIEKWQLVEPDEPDDGGQTEAIQQAEAVAS